MENIIGPIDARFRRGATHLLAGPSASGKTRRTSRILQLKNNIIENGQDIKNIVFCYNAWQDEYDYLNNNNIVTKWVNKQPSNDEFIDS